MITDAQTNFVYFSEILQTKPAYSAFYERLTAILDKHEVDYAFLSETNDIWCRDYMPVQVAENKFIEYRYDPDYLQEKKYRKQKTYPDLVCDSIGLKTIKTDLILDGGNIIKWANKVILTDKIIPENAAKYLKSELLHKLELLFEVDSIILVPWIPEEKFGHADGMIRFIDEQHVLVDGYYINKNKDFKNKFYKILYNNKLLPVELIFNVPRQSSKNWGYLNFLQMKDLLFFPQFGIEEDDQALQQIKAAFPDYAAKGQIETINCNEIINDGGVLNCISWNIKR
jgi:agmatine/peptidylarginine deiminase